MRENYDFSDAVKNPFAGREKGKYKVTVSYDFSVGKRESASNVNVKSSVKRTRKPKSKAVHK